MTLNELCHNEYTTLSTTNLSLYIHVTPGHTEMGGGGGGEGGELVLHMISIFKFHEYSLWEMKQDIMSKYVLPVPEITCTLYYLKFSKFRASGNISSTGRLNVINVWPKFHNYPQRDLRDMEWTGILYLKSFNLNCDLEVVFLK